MTGDIGMGGNKITNLPDPTSNTEPVTKSYAVSRYIRKTKLTTFEWFWGYTNVKALHFPTYRNQWPAPVRTDEITDNTNIELRHITLDNELALVAEIQACTLHVVFRYYTSNTTYHEKEIFTLPLTGKSVISIPILGSTMSFTVPLEEEYWLRHFIPANTNVLAFRLNEAGQYG